MYTYMGLVCTGVKFFFFLREQLRWRSPLFIALVLKWRNKPTELFFTCIMNTVIFLRRFNFRCDLVAIWFNFDQFYLARLVLIQRTKSIRWTNGHCRLPLCFLPRPPAWGSLCISILSSSPLLQFRIRKRACAWVKTLSIPVNELPNRYWSPGGAAQVIQARSL